MIVVVTLGVFGLGIRGLRSFLPDPPTNAMQAETADYMRQGMFHALDWRPLDDAAMSEARRTDRPILLVLGAAWSTEARRMDQRIFADPEVASFLSRNFICVRVDLDERPQWRSAFLPVSRGQGLISSGFQMFYLDPEGQLYDFYPRRGPQPYNDPVIFLDEFVSARRRFEEVRQGDGGPYPAGAFQRADLQMIESARSRYANGTSYLARLLGEINQDYGGFSRSGQVPRPLAVMFLQMHGEFDAWRTATDPMLRSGLVDWLDGGFYRASRSENWTSIEFDKLALHNAEMMVALGAAGQQFNDPFYLRIAKNTFDALLERFTADEGWVSAARKGDEDARERSAYASFAVKELRRMGGTGWLTAEETDLARDFLGLVVEENPQMVIRVQDPSEFADPRFDPLIAKLRESRKTHPAPYSRALYAHVNFGVVASAFRAARIWNDPERIARAENLLARLEPFLSGRDVTHRMHQQVGDRPVLPDYLNAVEAFVEHYLATGRVDSLERGLKILQRAKMLFAEGDHWYLSVSRAGDLEPVDTRVPELIDTPTEATSARVIRLLSKMGRLFRGGPQGHLASQYTDEALLMAARYGAIVGELGVGTAGMLVATSWVLDERHAIVVGDDAVAQARELSGRVPMRLVAPAFGDVRVDLQARGAGIYIVDGLDAEGPMTLEEAIQRLPATYDTRMP